MDLFVGNLPFTAKVEDLKKVFEAYGAVALASIKKKSGQNSRGFGFISMPDEAQAKAAMTALAEKDFMGRPMSVTERRIKPPKPKKPHKSAVPTEHKPGITIKVSSVTELAAIDNEVKEKRPKESPSKKRSSKEGSSKDAKLKPRGPRKGEWQNRKGRGPAKAWKKKPGGIKKKFDVSSKGKGKR